MEIVYNGNGKDNVKEGLYHKMFGRGGDDDLKTTAAFSKIYGGDGNDKLNQDDSAAGPITIFGQDGNDTMDGGSFNDDLSGGNGNDLMTGWSSGDLMDGGKGNDRMFGFWNTSQYPDTNDGPDILAGKAGNDKLHGQRGDDRLLGGTGKDVLWGGEDLDVFVFNTKLSSGNVDTIKDFNRFTDLIELDGDIFTRLAGQPQLEAHQYHEGAKAGDASDRIIYNAATGALFYDKDGKGGADQVKFADIGEGQLIDQTNFTIAP